MRIEGLGGIIHSALIIISLLTPLVVVGRLFASSTTISLMPTDDAEVREVSPKSNHGTSAIMWVESAKRGKNSRIFLKFDLSPIPLSSAITRARLYLYCQAAICGDLNVQAREVNNDNWAEYIITWNNQPSHGGVLDNTFIRRCASSRWYSWDVTSFVQAEFEGDKILSICMRAEEENKSGKDGFRSKEHGVGATRPYLEVVYVRPIYRVAVSISPNEKSEPPGATLNYTVVVTNLGEVEDNYALRATDNSGWGPVLSENSLTIPSGENRQTKLMVTIPVDALGGVEDNMVVIATGTGVSASASCIARVKVVRSVNVLISPTCISALPNENLFYVVAVTNLGNVLDIYSLSASDLLGWPLMVLPNSLTVPPWENRTATLSVMISSNAIGCTEDNVTVTATGTGVSDSASCIAHAAIVRKVNVSISPDYQSGLNCATLNYIVTVKNMGNVPDNYDLSANDNSGWSLSISPSSLTLAPGAFDNASLDVTIHLSATGCTEDLITVTARSRSDNTVEGIDNCVAHVTIVRGVEVSVSPSYQSSLNGTMLTYTVTVANTGNVKDTYVLTATDNGGWGPSVSPSSLTVPSWENRTATLSVTVPAGAIGCTSDNITVTATGTGVSDSDSCIAHATIFRGVEVSILPSYQSGLPGATLTYAVTIANTSNVSETYDLVASDNLGWAPTVSPSSLTVPRWENRNATLSVNLPMGGIGCTIDNITVTATSQSDPSVRASDNCSAHVAVLRGVKVSISPGWQENRNGGTLAYTVVIRNTGNVSENYRLKETDTLGWPLTLEDWLFVPKDENKTTKLWVNIPENAVGCTNDNITVTAISTDNAAVRDNDSCIAHVVIIRGVDVVISPKENSNFPGEVLIYVVAVKNTGNILDNYSLTVDNTQPWAHVLENTWLSIPAGENRSTALRVTIHENAENCTRDNITITATSQADSSVKDNDSCIAHAVTSVPPPLRGIDVKIVPSENSGVPGETLSYVVVVMNLGNVADNYVLAASDNMNWGPMVSPTSLVVPAGDNKIATLSVTIPSTAVVGTGDNITIAASGTGVSDSASCIAHVVSPRGVVVSISPTSKSGVPGSSLTFEVTVRNTGQVDDSYLMNVTGPTEWSPRLEPTSLSLAAGASSTVAFSIRVPDNAKEGESAIFTVNATSRAEPEIGASATCRAIAIAAPLPLFFPLLAALILIALATFVAIYLRRKAKAKEARRRVLKTAMAI